MNLKEKITKEIKEISHNEEIVKELLKTFPDDNEEMTKIIAQSFLMLIAEKLKNKIDKDIQKVTCTGTIKKVEHNILTLQTKKGDVDFFIDDNDLFNTLVGNEATIQGEDPTYVARVLMVKKEREKKPKQTEPVA